MINARNFGVSVLIYKEFDTEFGTYTESDFNSMKRTDICLLSNVLQLIIDKSALSTATRNSFNYLTQEIESTYDLEDIFDNYESLLQI